MIGTILFYGFVFFSIATCISFFFYRKRKPLINTNPKINSFLKEVEPNTPPYFSEAEPIMPQHERNRKSNPQSFQRELEGVLLRKIDAGELEVDLEPVLDERVKNTVELMGLRWKLRIRKPKGENENSQVNFDVPEEPSDPDVIPEDMTLERRKPKEKEK